MPKCQSCAANYDDNFRYCPYCGTAKPTPQVLVVQGADPRLYEEGVLRLRCMIENQIVATGTGLFGKTYEQREPLRIVQVELAAMSHDRGDYIALISNRFRHLLPRKEHEHSSYLGGYAPSELEQHLRDAFDLVETGKQYIPGRPPWLRPLLETLFREQRDAWESFNTALRDAGWFGVTDEAIGRRPPRSGNGGWWSILAQYPSGWADIKPKDPYHEPYYDESDRMRNYRYRRQI